MAIVHCKSTVHQHLDDGIDLPGGPLTPGDIPRTVIADGDDLHVVVHLGGLADLLARASAA